MDPATSDVYTLSLHDALPILIISLQVFDLLFQLTNGGPGFETTTITYYIYTAAFGQLSLGYSAMLALFLMILIVVFSLRSEEHTSELQSLRHLVCRLLLEKKK